MSNKRLGSTITINNLNKVLKRLDYLQDQIEAVAEDTVEEVAEDMAKRIEEKFMIAPYDGERDVHVSVVNWGGRNGNKGEMIKVTGESVLFIEYGTGFIYPQVDGVPAEYERGSYSFGTEGKGMLEKKDYWVYKGSRGDHPTDKSKVNRDGKVFTWGNPASMIMYKEKKNAKSALILSNKARKLMRQRGIL